MVFPSFADPVALSGHDENENSKSQRTEPRQSRVARHVSHPLAQGRHAWIHVAEGELSLNGNTRRGGDAAALSEEMLLELSAMKPAQVLLFDLN